jgi:hypothetical protein
MTHFDAYLLTRLEALLEVFSNFFGFAGVLKEKINNK